MKIGLKARFSDFEQVMALHPDFVEFQFSDQDADYDFKSNKKYSIPCYIHLPEIWHGYLIDLANIKNENQVLPLKKARDVIQKVINKSLRFFKYFTCDQNVFILHPGGMSYERDYPENNQVRYDTLVESLSLIKTDGAEIIVENLPPYPWYLGGQWNSNIFMDAEEIDKFCQITKNRICCDASHSKLYCNYAKKDFFDQMRLFKKNMNHLHIADATGVDGEGIQIDEGEIDFTRFFNLLKDYHGTIVNEIWMGYTNDFLGFKIAIEKIKKYLNTIKSRNK